MKGSGTLQAAIGSYMNAKAKKQEAIRTIFNEIACTLKNAGYNAQVITRGRNDYFFLDIHLRFQEGFIIVLSGTVRDIDPSPESPDSEKPEYPTDLHKAEEPQK